MYKSPFYSTKGVTVSEQPLASYIGARFLEHSNAIDAAVATSLTLAVTLPHLGGIGGDFFALIRDPEGRVYFIDGSGYAPCGLTIDFIENKGFSEIPIHSVYSINIPGYIDGLWLMWKRFGEIDWSNIVLEVARIARNGFGVTHSLADSLVNYRSVLFRDSGSMNTYYIQSSIKSGDKLILPNLANALELIASDPRVFYEGVIAESIVDYVNNLGGVLCIEDFRKYRAEEKEPVSINYRGRTLYEMPPSTQGLTTLHLFMLLEEYILSKYDPKSIDRYRILLESAEVAYYIRDKFITDSRYMSVRTIDLLKREFIYKHKTVYNKSRLSVGDGDTTFFATIDRDGWIVAGIQSLFYPFGSGITEPRYSITLNSRAVSYSLKRDHVNKLEPGKKTMHTLSAMIIEDNDRVLAIGLSGGHYRPILHAQIATNIIDYGMDPQSAIEFPRVVLNISENTLEYESGLFLDSLKQYILVEKSYPSRLGVAAIAENRSNGVRAGYADIRGDGLPIGLP